jgi:osmoprotectant transport system ATP-binding protein
MDEPFGALDPLTRAEMQTMLRDLFANVDKTVLLVTHDLPEALFLADRLIFVEAGEIVADVKSADVFSSDNPTVRRYIETVQRAMPTSAPGASHARPSPS